MAGRLTRLAALDRAKTFVGVREQPPFSNRGPQIDKWQKRTNGLVGYPWCAAFVTCMLEDVGYPVHVPGAAMVENWDRWAHDTGTVVVRPFRGDIVCFDWNSDRWHDHIGFVDRVLALRWSQKRFVGLLRTVEANTTADGAGNQSDGGGVYVRSRWVNASTTFVRIPGYVPNI